MSDNKNRWVSTRDVPATKVREEHAVFVGVRDADEPGTYFPSCHRPEGVEEWRGVLGVALAHLPADEVKELAIDEIVRATEALSAQTTETLRSAASRVEQAEREVKRLNSEGELIANRLHGVTLERDALVGKLSGAERERDDLWDGNESYRKGAADTLAMVREKLGADLHPWVSETVRLLCDRVLTAERSLAKAQGHIDRQTNWLEQAVQNMADEITGLEGALAEAHKETLAPIMKNANGSICGMCGGDVTSGSHTWKVCADNLNDDVAKSVGKLVDTELSLAAARKALEARRCEHPVCVAYANYEDRCKELASARKSLEAHKFVVDAAMLWHQVNGAGNAHQRLHDACVAALTPGEGVDEHYDDGDVPVTVTWQQPGAKEGGEGG